MKLKPWRRPDIFEQANSNGIPGIHGGVVIF
jgi:hypothetical protein